MNYEMKGKLKKVYETQKVSDKFQKREFILERTDEYNDKTFVKPIKFQLTQDKCDKIDSINEGELITVSFNIDGREWEKDGKLIYFNSLNAWKITKSTEDEGIEGAAKKVSEAIGADNDGLPF